MREQEFLDSGPKPTRRPKPSLGFRFTSDERRRMRRAITASVRFMQTYGQGWNPDQYGVKEMIIKQQQANGCFTTQESADTAGRGSAPVADQE